MNHFKKLSLSLAALLAAGVSSALAQGTPSTFTYNARGQVVSATTPGGRTHAYQWDTLGRNISQSSPGFYVGMGYNGQDRLVAVVDPKGLSTSYGRNGHGEAQTLTSPDTGTSTLSFDLNGNLTSRVNAAGQVESYTYDAADRVTTKTLTHPVSGSITYSFVYGTSGPSAGRVVQVTAPGLALGFGHNLFGQVTSASQAVNGGPTLSVGYSYASNGALTSITYPSGRVVTFSLDGASRAGGVSSGGSTLLSGIGYSPLGAVAGWTFGNGQAVSRTFDLNGRTSGVTMPGGQRAYGYDADDRIVATTDAVLGNATYGYDNQDRLTSASTALGQWAYQYDANGNRTLLTIDGSSYAVVVDEASNRALAMAAPFVRASQYTADGQTSLVTGGSPTPACGSNVSLGYTADGQLVTSNVLSAVFSPDGLRLQKTPAACAGGGATNFVYDMQGHLLGEYDSTGAPIQETVWLSDIPVAVFKSNGTAVVAHYVYADNLGSPRAITNTAGQAVWRWDGEPFGATPANENPSGLGPFTYGLRFPGQYYDAETGYHQNWWREYDPKVGRYVQSDPIGLVGGVNTYLYAEANPLARIDPNGLLGPLAVGFARVVIPFLANAYRLNRVGVAVAEVGAGVSLAARLPLRQGAAIVGAAENLCVSTIAGRLPRNSRMAGGEYPLPELLAKKYPEGVRFSSAGFPDFSQHARATIRSDHLSGLHAADAALANKLAGLPATPRHWTWHHVEDGTTMHLIPLDLHRAVAHSGGASILRNAK